MNYEKKERHGAICTCLPKIKTEQKKKLLFFHFFRAESDIVLIQPGGTIIKTTLGANFEAERAKQLRGAMQKNTKKSVVGDFLYLFF